MLPVISTAWSHNVEVLTINEKESDSFIEKLFDFKQPDLIFSSLSENRVENFISLQDNLAELKFDEKKLKKKRQQRLIHLYFRIDRRTKNRPINDRKYTCVFSRMGRKNTVERT
jgi:hypothetical protein